MGEFNWVRALDALGRGHTLQAVEQVRQMAEAFGVEGPIPLHATEAARAKELKEAAERNLKQAQLIEERANG
jgi:hypothetical protein